MRRLIAGLLAASGTVAAAGLLLLAWGAGTADAAGSCTIYWTGATSTAWTTNSNWSLTDGGGSAGRGPTNTDVVCMSSAPTRSTVVLSASKTVAGITFADTSSVHPSLEVTSSYTLTIGSTSNGAYASTVNNFMVDSGATIAGTAGVTATGSGTTLGNATLTGPASFTLGSSTSVTLNGLTLSTKRRLINQGSVLQTGVVYVSGISVVENAGSYLANSSSSYVYPQDATANSFVNDVGATYTVSVSGSSLYGYVPLTNNGTLATTAGDFLINSGASGSGVYTTSSGATLHAAGGTVSITGATFSGAGTFAVDGGTVTGSASVPVLQLNGGALDGSGTLTVPAGGTGTLSNITLSHGYRLLNNGTLSNPSANGSWYVYLYNASTIENAGTLNLSANGGYGVGIYSQDSTANALLNDAGATLAAASTAGNGSISLVAPLTNLGTLKTTSGDLYVQAGASGAGSYVTSSGATLHANGATFSLAGASFSGAGTFAVDGATVSGSAAVANLALNGGTLDGSGTLTVPAGGTGTLSNITLSHGYRLLNNGTLSNPSANGNWYAYLYNASTIENAGTLNLSANGGYTSQVYAQDGTANALLNDAGATLTAASTAGNGYVYVTAPLTNQGTVKTISGDLYVQGGASGAGSYVTSSGATLHANGGTFSLAGASFSGAGTFAIDGGTVSGTATITNVAFNGGTLNGSGVLTVSGTGILTNISLDHGYRLLNNGTLSNPVANGSWYAYLYNASTIENAGTLNLSANGGYSSQVYAQDGTANALLNDAGATLNAASTAGNGNVYVSAPLTSQGTVKTTSGDLYVQGGASGAGSYVTSSGATLHANGGTFSLAGASFSGAGTFAVDGGTVSGSATVPNLALNSGTLDGSSTLTIPTSGTALLRNISLSHGYRLLNNGTLSTPSSTTNYYYAYLSNASTIENAGTMTLASGSGGYYSQLSDQDGSGNALINDAGATLASSGVLYENVPLTNQGTVTTTAGDLYLGGGATGAGSYATSAGATLHASGARFTVTGATFTGAGTLAVDGATVSGNATVPNLALNAGTLDGSGTLTVPVSGTATLTNISLSHGYRLLNQGTLINPSTNGYFYAYLYNASTIENAGTMTLGASNGYSSTVADQDGSANAVINDAGATLNASVTGGGQLSISPALTNNGTVNAKVGTVNVTNLTNLSSAGVLTGGALVTSGGTLQIQGSIVTNNASITVTSGSIKTGSTNALAGLRTNTGTLVEAGSLNVGGALTNSGTLTQTSGTLQATTYTQSAGVTTVASGATLKATSGLLLNGGILTGVGSVVGNVSGAGTVQPGGGSGPLAVTGNLTDVAGSKLAIGISGPSAPGTDFGKLTVSGAANLGGTLAISTASGYSPPVGTTYQILTAGSLTGTFATIAGQDLPNGTYYDPSYTSAGVTLTVTQAPTVSVGSVSQAEGDSGTSTLTVPVTLSAATDRPVTVNFTTADGTATAPSDYASTSGTLTIPVGSTSASVPVTIKGDTTYEPDETFTAQLTAPSGATLGTASGTQMITNDDAAPPSSSVTSVSPSTIGQAASNQTLTITGTGFASGSTVSLSNSGITVNGSPTVVNATTITVNVSVSANAPTGAGNVTVITPGTGSATCTGCLTVTARPTITTTPTSLQTGATNVELVVGGSGFQPGAIVTVAGHAGVTTSTSYVDSGTLSVLTSVATTASVGTYSVTVVNPDGGTQSCSTCFSVTAGPKVTALNPSSLRKGTSTVVTITGSNFAPGASVVGPAGVTVDGVVVQNSTTITATFTVSTKAKAAAKQPVVVTNRTSAGGGRATATLLTITT